LARRQPAAETDLVASLERWSGAKVAFAGAAAIGVIVLIDRWLSGGSRSLLATGIADETGHLLTTLILLAAVSLHLPVRFLAGALIGSVAIDLDHLPLILGSEILTQSTNRPFPHSLLTIVVVLALTLALPPRWRWFGFGIAAGVAAHFPRDMASSTAGVPLFWPLSREGFRLPYDAYLVMLISCVVLAAWVATRRNATRRSVAENTKEA
jgi:hypothetical protein